MYPVSANFLRSVRQSHAVVTRVDAYMGATCIASDLPVSDGNVDATSTPGVRRTLSVTIADPSLWDTLSSFGVELRPYRGIRLPDGDEELVPLGVFSLDQISRPVLTGGGLAITSAPDRWVKVQRARFELPRASDTGFTNVQEIIRLVTEVVPAVPETGGVTTANILGETKILKPVVWDQDRDAAINDLAVAAGVEVYFDQLGRLVLRDLPVMDGHPAWRINTGRTGVMTSGTATRDRTRVYNVVIVSSTKTDGTPPFTPQVAADMDPTSPTNVTGAYGRVPFFYSTALIGDSASAMQMAKNLLAKTRARFTDMAVESAVNPALEPGDTVSVAGVDGNEQLYLVESVSVPLGVDGTQTITLKSLAAVTADSASVGTSTATST